MQGFRGCRALLCSFLTLHVQGDPSIDVSLRADAIDGLLHFAVTAVAALHGVGRRGQQGIIKEGQRLFNVGREEFPERCSDGNEGTSDSAAKSGEFFQRCLRTTASERG